MRKTVSVLVVLGLVALCSSATADVRIDKASGKAVSNPAVAAENVVSVEGHSVSSGRLTSGQMVIGGGGQSVGPRDIGDTCTLDPGGVGTGSYCQMPPESGGGAADGTVLTRSGTNYDDFKPLGAGQVLSEFCWWGGYFNGTDAECTPTSETWTVEIWDNVLGLPTNLLAQWVEASFQITVTKTDTLVDLTFSAGTISIYEYTAVVSGGLEYAVTDGDCYFLRLINDVEPLDECYWWWRTADDDGAIPFGDDWSTSGDFDQAFCINVECDDNPSECLPTLPCTQPPSNCQADGGNWWIGGETQMMLDNFKATVTAPIITICWDGSYVGPVGSNPWSAEEDNFTVMFWTDSDSDGFPDTVSGTYNQDLGTLINVLRAQQGVTPLSSGNEGLDYEYSATLDLPGFDVVAGQCYFIGVQNEGASAEATSYYHRTSTDGDGYMLVGPQTGPWDCGTLYDPAPYGPHDMPFCIDQALDPDPGSCVYNVVNDECLGAIEVFCGDVIGDDEPADNCLATNGLDDPDILNDARDWTDCFLPPIFADNTVWYKWVATDTNVTIKTCATTGADDTVVGIYRLLFPEDPCTNNLVEAFAHGSPTSSTRSCGNPANHAMFCPGTLIEGDTYYIMVGSDPATAPGAFILEIACDAECEAMPTGACCQPDQSCYPDPNDPPSRPTAADCFCNPIPPYAQGTAWYQDQACSEVACPATFCGEEGYCQFYNQQNAWFSDPDVVDGYGNQGRIYDDFVPATEGAIVSICFDGIWIPGTCTSGQLNFEVGYYNDTGLGLPDIDTPIAVYTTDDALVVGGYDTGQGFAPPTTTNVWRMTALHPAVPVTAGECYWISVRGLEDNCVYLWLASSDEFGGNGRKALWTPGGGLEAYDEDDQPPGEGDDGDQMFCIDLGLVEGSCADVVGACCLQGLDDPPTPPSCVEVETEALCAEHESGQAGIWRGPNTSCADVNCAVGACCSSQTECTETIADDCQGGGPVCTFTGDVPVCMGDGNGDGKVSPADVSLIKFYYGRDCTDPAFQEVCCRYDLNCDGSISPADVSICKFEYVTPCDADPPLHEQPPESGYHCPAYYGGGASGEFYGYGSVCPTGRDDGEITCACACPPDGIDECQTGCAYEDAETDCNSGCWATTPVFDPLSGGDTVCGMVSIVPDPAQPGYVLRDGDWFSFSTIGAGPETYVTFSVYSDFVAQIFVFEADCENGEGFMNVGEAGECTLTEIAVCLPESNWYAVVMPDFAGNNWSLPCTQEDNHYYATLTFGDCGDHLGACCSPEVCEATTNELACTGWPPSTWTKFWVEDETCPEFDCAAAFPCDGDESQLPCDGAISGTTAWDDVNGVKPTAGWSATLGVLDDFCLEAADYTVDTLHFEFIDLTTPAGGSLSAFDTLYVKIYDLAEYPEETLDQVLWTDVPIYEATLTVGVEVVKTVCGTGFGGDVECWDATIPEQLLSNGKYAVFCAPNAGTLNYYVCTADEVGFSWELAGIFGSTVSPYSEWTDQMSFCIGD